MDTVVGMPLTPLTASSRPTCPARLVAAVVLALEGSTGLGHTGQGRAKMGPQQTQQTQHATQHDTTRVLVVLVPSGIPWRDQVDQFPVTKGAVGCASVTCEKNEQGESLGMFGLIF